MPIILAGFVLLPFLLGAVIQYAVCRFTRRKRWRVLPGLAAAVLALLIAAGRWNLWASEQVSPLTQVLFFPGLPAGGFGSGSGGPGWWTAGESGIVSAGKGETDVCICI